MFFPDGFKGTTGKPHIFGGLSLAGCLSTFVFIVFVQFRCRVPLAESQPRNRNP